MHGCIQGARQRGLSFWAHTFADPRGLLEGTGKNMRHVKIRPGTEINREALAVLIQTAYVLVKSRARSETGLNLHRAVKGVP